MQHLRLMRLEGADELALSNDPEYQRSMAENDWERLAKVIQRIVQPGLKSALPVVSAPPHWGGYLAIDDASDALIGSCAFKAPPTADGVIEIAYFTYPGFEGRGYATLMARQLIDIAAGSTSVRRVIAHTLPETGASTRVLEKVGMRSVGEVMDPDDGRVWRWELPVGG